MTAWLQAIFSFRVCLTHTNKTREFYAVPHPQHHASSPIFFPSSGSHILSQDDISFSLLPPLQNSTTSNSKMQSTNVSITNFCPLPNPKHETALSRQRRKFLAKQRLHHQERIPESEMQHDYEAVQRIHSHHRKNISGKDTAMRPKRRSKHELEHLKQHVSSDPKQRRASGKVNRRRSSILLLANGDLDWLKTSANSFDSNSSNGSNPRGTSPTRGAAAGRGRRTRRRSLIVSSGIPSSTPTTPPGARKKRSSIAVHGRSANTEHELIATLNNKFSLNW